MPKSRWFSRRRFAPVLAALGGLAAARASATEVAPGAADPTRAWEFEYQSGVLWRAGGRTSPLDYVIAPQVFTWKAPAHWRRRVAGRDLVLRARFSALVEPILRGPENYYVGGAAAGTLEWWNDARTQAWFFSAGGGAGWMDSRGQTVAGGQGQDLNLNWLLYGGARWRHGERFHASAGVYFQHISNGGMKEPNPGVDAVGPMLGLGWKF